MSEEITVTIQRPKAPKTPSPGQMRAIAKALDDATIPATDPLLLEARDVVQAWMLHRAEIGSVAK